MKSIYRRLFQANLLVALLALILPLRSFAEGGEESTLHDEMQGINRSVRQLGRQIDDPAKKDSSLKLVAEIQQHAEKAKTLTPPKSGKMSGDEKTGYIATFHKDLDALIKEVGMLKEAIAADKTEVAKAELQKIGQLKNSSHKDLGVEMGPPGGGRKRGGPPPAPGQ